MITFIFLLYCCIHVSTPYDKEINDIEQEKFLKAWAKGR